jgi:hypothetical protein
VKPGSNYRLRVSGLEKLPVPYCCALRSDSIQSRFFEKLSLHLQVRSAPRETINLKESGCSYLPSALTSTS